RAQDHAAVRAGLRLILQEDEAIEVVAEAADGAAALTNARALGPDVVLMDIRMPVVDAVEATAAITAEGLADGLVLTTFELDEYVFSALRAGAAGFLLKSAGAAELIQAVHTVAGGEGVVAPQVTRRLLSAFADSRPGTAERVGIGAEDGADDGAGEHAGVLAQLTAREREVLALLARGQSNQQIASALVISPATTKTHVSRVLAKLGCASRVQARSAERRVGQ